MKDLLDTHTFLWMAADPGCLSEKIRKIVRDGDSALYLRAASDRGVTFLTKDSKFTEYNVQTLWWPLLRKLK